MENMIVEEGEYKNTSFSTYLVPTAADVPPIDPLLVEVYDPTGPFGAKGIAEPATIATIPAIMNAVARAIGVRLYQTPATAERILTALGKLSMKEKLPSLEDIPYPP